MVLYTAVEPCSCYIIWIICLSAVASFYDNQVGSVVHFQIFSSLAFDFFPHVCLKQGKQNIIITYLDPNYMYVLAVLRVDAS